MNVIPLHATGNDLQVAHEFIAEHPSYSYPKPRDLDVAPCVLAQIHAALHTRARWDWALFRGTVCRN